ncbi:MAG: endonuclease/exonuclease/phosphatase family protein [Desulfuromonadales bacterium]|nr:endonuclease/exonuclease/phosphatase family protein [Desulfuromonadales bacterium]
MPLRLASYNIHRCYGRAGFYDPESIKAVLDTLDAHIIALQEVELLHRDPGLLDFLCVGKPWQALHDITMNRTSGHYGNALLTSLPILSIERHDLSVAGREPRGALHVILDNHGKKVEVMATHLGLRPAERRAQIQALLQRLQASPGEHTKVLLGDLNEWFLWGRPLRWLQRNFSATPAPRTFPARWPLFALDRIWVKPRRKLVRLSVPRSPLIRRASDHLPLVAELCD